MKNNLKPLVCIFAHPDDEAFGPGGSIAKFASERDVYLISITNGDAGKSSNGQSKMLGVIRRKELSASSRILGIKKVFFLNFKDGNLNNNLYHEIALEIEKILLT